MICPQCQFAYHKNRKPMLFACGHTFCSQCINSVQNSQCFECQKVDIPFLNIAMYQQAVKANANKIDEFFKVCLFGSMGVGKTSLLKRMIGQGFDQNIIPTIGLDFKFIDVKKDGKTYRYQFWDSAGQERYRCMTKNYVRGCDIILLVYDISKTKNENMVSYWINEFKSFIAHNNVLVIGNKIDLLQNNDKCQMSISEDQMTEIADNQWDSAQISCLRGQNIEALWEIISKKEKSDPKNSEIKLGEKKAKNLRCCK